MSHRTWVEIDQGALKDNVRQLQSILSEDAHICAVVKSNAYGHDSALASSLCEEAGITSFMVNSLDEGEHIRKYLTNPKIYIWNWVDYSLSDFSNVSSHYIFPVYRIEQIAQLAMIAKKHSKRLSVNLIINTGMNRLGILPKHIDRVIMELRQNEAHVLLESISSHLHSADEANEPYSDEQNDRFAEIASRIYREGFRPATVHIANSAGTLKSQQFHYNMVRIGALIYGLWPSDYMEKRSKITYGLQIQPVLSWKTRIIQLRDVEKGERIGYNGSHLCDTSIRIAVLPIGYDDGVLAGIGKKHQVLIRGIYCRVLSVTMNMMIVDVSNVPHVEIDDETVIIGRQGMNEIRAKWMHYDTRNITTAINPLIPRIVV